jgi:RNA polymerase sigma-70 factor (ECF subfamily)
MPADPLATPAIPDQPARADTTIRLLEQAREGDTAALDALFARYVGPLRRWASGRMPRWARDAADTQDIVQDTLLQTLKRIGDFEPRREGALQAYLRQAVMNRIKDLIRRHNRRGASEALDTGIEGDGPSPVEAAIGSQTAERYERALARLRPEDREANIARVELSCTYEQLAVALGKPSADAARKAAQQALVRLAAEMKHERR